MPSIDESQPHTHAADGSSVAVVDESQPHTHPTDSTIAGAPAATWPRPWDPTKPIDVSGVPGVTPEQEARATALIEGSLKDLPKYADTAAAVADGYASIGDAGTGSEHYIKLSLIEDNDFLDPAHPESLVYNVDGDKRTLAGAMYIASARPTDDPSLLSFAGPLMQWHNHGNLCWGVGPDGKPRVVGITDANGNCAQGVNTGGQNPMVHVWVTPHPCGVFAALEGVGAGQAAVPDAQRVDLCNQPHTHAAAAVPTKPYDPTQPIDLGGVPGVTPEQQAAAENLVALNVVRLPQWADYKVAEAAGFHSIGDGLTGFEHYIKWDWINDDVTLDPDHPESLVYSPQPDGSKKLVSAMYFLPDTVALTDVPNIGGALMQWHIHNNLCFTDDPVAPQVRGVTDVERPVPTAAQASASGTDDPRVDHPQQVRPVRRVGRHRRRADRRRHDAVVRRRPRVGLLDDSSRERFEQSGLLRDGGPVTTPVLPSTRTVAPSGMLARRAGGRDHARDAQLAADDDRVAERRPDVDDHCGCRHEQRRPRRVGDRRDQHVAGLQRGGIVGVEDDPSRAFGHSRAPGSRPTVSPPDIRATLIASRRAHVSGPLGMADEHERRLELLASLWYSARRARTASVSECGSVSNVGISASRTKPKSSTSSNAPRSTIRRPSSRIAMRISWITLMLLVLVRSRPGSHAAEQPIAAAS